MRKAPLVMLVTVALVLATMPAVTGRHNSVGLFSTVGAGTSEAGGADVPPSFYPAYHADVIAGGRASPPDQSYRANWVGFLDGEMEYVLPQVPGTATFGTDPLYRVNPAPGDQTCDTFEEQTDTTKCTGQAHQMIVAARVAFDGNFVDTGGRTIGTLLARSTASGTLYPGTYILFAYLFGKPSPNHGTIKLNAGQGTFANIPGNVCTQRNGAFDDSLGCVLLNTADLQYYSAASPEADVANLCVESSPFHALSGGPDPNAPCGAGIHLSAATGYLESDLIGNMIVDRPGWRFGTTYILGPKPGSLLCTPSQSQCDVRNLPDWWAAGGNDAAAGHHGAIMKGLTFHFTVNAVPVDRVFNELYCVLPSIATDAGTVDGVIKGQGNYLYAAHDLDVYTHPFRPEVDATFDAIRPTGPILQPAAQQVNPFVNAVEDPVRMVDIVQDDIINPTLDQLLPNEVTDAANDAIQRADPVASEESTTEDHMTVTGSPRTWALTTGGYKCVSVQAQVELVSAPPDTLNGALRMNVVASYRDPTTTVGLPAVREPGTELQRDDALAYHPWHAGVMSLATNGADPSSAIEAVIDLNKNGVLNGCTAGARAPLSTEDKCVWGMLWDAYNTAALIGACGTAQTTVAECATSRGYDISRPTGLVQVWRITGPVVVYDEDIPGGQAALADYPGRLGSDLGSGAKCVVGYSKGLKEKLDAFPAEKAPVVAHCGNRPVAIEILDAFDDQGSFGSYSSALNVLRGNAGPGDGVTLVALLATGSGGLSDDNDNLALAGSTQYRWFDTDAFV